MTPDQEKKLNEIHSAIVGNPALGQEGIIPRLIKLEDYKRKDEKFKNKIAGALLIATPILVIVWHWIQKYILEL